ncbi:MAG: DUF5662 family protein [Eubacteriales bacterium]|nr:DUF5662 family protein [Eubacteriales bacterium]
MHVWGHFKTITKHRHMVMKLCFRAGLYRQGLAHDLSKYSYTEFSKGIRYFQGDRSPNNYEREVTGISLSWLHHKGRNKHHFEYWLDYDIKNPANMTGMIMPRKYVAEMFCDRIAACRVYERDAYTPASPARFFYRSDGRFMMHDVTRRELGYLLTFLSVRGLDEALSYVRHQYLRGADIPEVYTECGNLREFNEMLEAGELEI